MDEFKKEFIDKLEKKCMEIIENKIINKAEEDFSHEFEKAYIDEYGRVVHLLNGISCKYILNFCNFGNFISRLKASFIN